MQRHTTPHVTWAERCALMHWLRAGEQRELWGHHLSLASGPRTAPRSFTPPSPQASRVRIPHVHCVKIWVSGPQSRPTQSGIGHVR